MNAKKVKNKAYHNLCKLLDQTNYKISETDINSIIKNIDEDYQTIYNPKCSLTMKRIHKRQKNIQIEIKTLKDIIDLCDKYPLLDDVEYNIDMESIHAIKGDLMELNNMIGMERLKESVLDQILYFIQKFNHKDYMHTVIYGSPGTGKTEIARIMGKIFSNIGCL